LFIFFRLCKCYHKFLSSFVFLLKTQAFFWKIQVFLELKGLFLWSLLMWEVFFIDFQNSFVYKGSNDKRTIRFLVHDLDKIYVLKMLRILFDKFCPSCFIVNAFSFFQEATILYVSKFPRKEFLKFL
jgi:hypothetical protein